MQPKHIAASFLGTLTAGLVIVGFTRIAGPIPLHISQTTTAKQSTFDVTGDGEVSATPDRAIIDMGVQASENTVQAAQTKGNQVISAITKDLTAMGIDKADIKTTNYSLYPTYDYQGGKQRITSYSLNINLQVKLKDFDKINTVVDTATKDGANQVGGVQFTLSDEKRRDVENQVREIAIGHAKEKAQSLSKISGVQLGNIVNVTENTNNGNPRPYPMMAKDVAVAGMGGGSAGAPTEVQPGSSTFTMSVTLSYETR